jgi:hypothetical protein
MIYVTSSPLFASFLEGGASQKKNHNNGGGGGGQQILKAKGSDGKYQGE